ncbi:MAG: hypothetical protein R3E95_07370 [Thiolinea sp.]
MMLSLQRIWATFYARNLEFIRDRFTMGWNLLLPVLLVLGLAFLFTGEGQPLFKAAVLTDAAAPSSGAQDASAPPHPFLATPQVEFLSVDAAELPQLIRKVGRHQLDMLVDVRPGSERYWINEESPKGQVLQKILQGSGGPVLAAQSVQGEAIRYVDWVVPGVLGMNIMFSCLFGVGYVIALPQEWLSEAPECHATDGGGNSCWRRFCHGWCWWW